MGTHLLPIGYHGKKKKSKKGIMFYIVQCPGPWGVTLHLIHGQLAKVFMDILSMIQFAPKVIAQNFLNNNLEKSCKIQAQLVKLCFPYFFK
jgi:hypothetical protein